MANFITAADAYTKSLESFNAMLAQNKEELMKLIDIATERAEFKVIYPKQLHPVVITWLDNLGYDVSSEEGTSYYIVSWEDAHE